MRQPCRKAGSSSRQASRIFFWFGRTPRGWFDCLPNARLDDLIGAMATGFKAILTELYNGSRVGSRRFRFGLIVFDAFTIVLFIAIAPWPHTVELEALGFVLGLLILADFSARLWIAENRLDMLRRIYTIADVIVIVSLLIAPFIHASLAFLRILRGLRILHSYQLLADLRKSSRFFLRHESAVIAAVNLFVFVFFTTSVVFALFVETTAGFDGYVDALYFTVTTLTTTGYGDITPTTTGGKLLAVLIMVVGVALFVQLARAIIQPSKVNYECKACGLLKHDYDASHCKHCGAVIRIKTEGAT
jgi:voltage-gated potassium channel